MEFRRENATGPDLPDRETDIAQLSQVDRNDAQDAITDAVSTAGTGIQAK